MAFREHNPCERFGVVVSRRWACGAKGGPHSGDRVLIECERHDGRWLLLVADLSGHGNEAVHVAADCLLRQLNDNDVQDGRQQGNQRPAGLLELLHSRFAHNIAQGKERTIAAGAFLIDGNSGELVGALAGFHRPFCGVPGQEWRRWELPVGILVGLDPWVAEQVLQENEPPFAEDRIQLTLGQKTLIYTDGLPDAKNEHGPFGWDAFEQYLRSLNRGDDGKALLDQLVATLASFDLEDDVTVVCLERP